MKAVASHGEAGVHARLHQELGWRPTPTCRPGQGGGSPWERCGRNRQLFGKAPLRQPSSAFAPGGFFMSERLPVIPAAVPLSGPADTVELIAGGSRATLREPD